MGFAGEGVYCKGINMKSEKEIRKRLNKLIADYFKKKFHGTDRYFAEARIRELVWILEEIVSVENGKAKLIGKDKK